MYLSLAITTGFPVTTLMDFVRRGLMPEPEFTTESTKAAGLQLITTLENLTDAE